MATDKIYDVAIVGGGLAGLSLAIQMAKKNYKVALYEKENYPFHKVCGEYISFESWNFLQELGVDLEKLQLPLIKKLHLSDSKGKTYSFDLPLGGFGISRFTLDDLLYHIAVAKGVDIFTGSKVNDIVFEDDYFTITAKDQVRARVVAASYGKRSNLDIKWKRDFTMQKANSLNNYIGIKYHIKYENDSRHIFLHNFSGGYCGLSNIENNKSCLCYLTTADNLRKSGNSIKEMERRILSRNPKLKEIFSSAEFLDNEPLAISQISFERKSQVQNHVLMVGDAAGLISPLCGNGMSMAMHSSKLASNSIHEFLQSAISRQQMETNYALEWKRVFSKRLWVGRSVQRFFGGDRSTSLFLQTMHTIPWLAGVLIRSTHGNPF